jgi:predicted nucleic acid-binding protein
VSFVVDTSVWSLALRREAGSERREVQLLRELLERGDNLYLLGVILQEILQGVRLSKDLRRLRRELESFPLIELDRDDYVLAADVWSRCRARGVQVSTVDAQIAASALRRGHALLTADLDFVHMAEVVPLKLA